MADFTHKDKTKALVKLLEGHATPLANVVDGHHGDQVPDRARLDARGVAAAVLGEKRLRRLEHGNQLPQQARADAAAHVLVVAKQRQLRRKAVGRALGAKPTTVGVADDGVRIVGADGHQIGKAGGLDGAVGGDIALLRLGFLVESEDLAVLIRSSSDSRMVITV